MHLCFSCESLLQSSDLMVRQAPAGSVEDSAGLNRWMTEPDNIFRKICFLQFMFVCRNWDPGCVRWCLSSVPSELVFEMLCWKLMRVFAQGSSFKPFHRSCGLRNKTASVLVCLWHLSHLVNFNNQAFKMKRWWQTVSMNETQLFITLDYGSGNITPSLLLVTCHI